MTRLNTCWIIGGSKGIGLALADTLQIQGWAVTSLSRQSGFDLDRPVEDIQTHIDRLLVADGLSLAGPERQYCVENGLKLGWRQFWHYTKQGAPDLAIISGGMGAYLGNWQWNNSNIDRLFRVNAISRMVVANQLIRAMRRRRSGKIILIGSRVAERGSHALEAYAASHAALRGYVHSACRHPAKRNVTVALIEVGWTQTEMTANLRPHIRSAIDAQLGAFLTADQAARLIIDSIKTIQPGDIIPIGN